MVYEPGHRRYVSIVRLLPPPPSRPSTATDPTLSSSSHPAADLYLTSTTYRPEINKYGVKASQSIEEWEKAGWIRAQDPRGWLEVRLPVLTPLGCLLQADFVRRLVNSGTVISSLVDGRPTIIVKVRPQPTPSCLSHADRLNFASDSPTLGRVRWTSREVQDGPGQEDRPGGWGRQAERPRCRSDPQTDAAAL